MGHYFDYSVLVKIEFCWGNGIANAIRVNLVGHVSMALESKLKKD